MKQNTRDIPIELVLIPQLTQILDMHLNEVACSISNITARVGNTGNINSSSHYVQKAECIKEVGRKFFSSLAKQIIHTYESWHARPQAGVVHFSEFSLKFINDVIGKEGLDVRGNRISESNKNIIVSAKEKLIELREHYASQLSYGFVDGVSWDSVPKDMQTMQIQNIYGDTYHVHAHNGTQHQFNMGGSSGIQNITTTNNDLKALHQLLAEIQISTLSNSQKEELSVPVEMFIDHAESVQPKASYLRQLGQQVLTALQDKSCDAISEAATNAAKELLARFISL